MKNKILSDDFFKNAILKGNSALFNEFTPSVTEREVGPDVFFEIEKNSEHRKINERITKFILSQIPINSSACGFVQGKSYFDFLNPHIKGYFFLRLDIKKFFHSIPASEVKSLFKVYFSNTKKEEKYSALDIALMAVLHKTSKSLSDSELRDKEILPIGFSSSPVISNIIFRKVDILIQKYCEDKNIEYSRYADDLLFSSAKSNFIHGEQFEREISIFISTLSLRLKKSKRTASENTISLNGYVIQNTKQKKLFNMFFYKDAPIGSIRVSNKKTKIIKKMTALLRQGKSPIYIMENVFNLNRKSFKPKYTNNYTFYNRYATDQLQNKIKGYRSYLVSIIKFNEKYKSIDEKFLKSAKKLVKELEDSIP
ncbi:RNA-directed DNA polymerase [Salmonella enterica subsp. enterica]|nr:RNA-directed DNA polymerase [Salmonella enterica subsp. enterica]